MSEVETMKFYRELKDLLLRHDAEIGVISGSIAVLTSCETKKFNQLDAITLESMIEAEEFVNGNDSRTDPNSDRPGPSPTPDLYSGSEGINPACEATQIH